MRYYVALGDFVGPITHVRVIEAKSVLAAKMQLNKISRFCNVFIFERMKEAFELDPESLVALRPGKGIEIPHWVRVDESIKNYFRRVIESSDAHKITFIGPAPKHAGTVRIRGVDHD